MHCCNLIGWGSPSQPIRSFSLKNLINIKSWFFPFSNEPAINISQQSTNILETITHRAKWSRCWYSQLYQHFFQVTFLNIVNSITLNTSISESVFEIPQVPFAFEFESEWLNDNLATKQSPNYHSSDLDKVSQMAK